MFKSQYSSENITHVSTDRTKKLQVDLNFWSSDKLLAAQRNVARRKLEEATMTTATEFKSIFQVKYFSFSLPHSAEHEN